MAQKITKVGNSAAAILPKSVLEQSGLKIGSAFTAAYKAGLGIVIEPVKKYSSTRVIIDKEVYAVANDLLKRYLPAFKKLAHA